MHCENLFNVSVPALNQTNITMAVLYYLAMLLILVVNTGSIVLILVSKKSKLIPNIHMININVNALLNLPCSFVINYTRLKGPCWMSSMTVCRLYAGLSIVPYTVNIYSMFFIAYEWYRRIVKLDSYEKTALHVFCELALTWVLSFFPAIIVLLEVFTTVKYEPKLYACVYDPVGSLYPSLFLSLQFFFLTLFSAVLYVKIVIAVHKTRIQVMSHRDSSVHESSLITRKKDIQLAKRFLIMFVVFQLLVDPTAVIQIFYLSLSQTLVDFASIMFISVHVFVPAIFAFPNKICKSRKLGLKPCFNCNKKIHCLHNLQ